MDELMQTAGRYIGRFWTDIAGAGESEEVADVARALVFTPLKALGKRARDAMLDISSPARPGPAAVGERRTVRAARRAPCTLVCSRCGACAMAAKRLPRGSQPRRSSS